MEMKYLVEMIIAVIILLIFVPMIIREAKNVISMISNKFGVTQLSKIDKAILCSYYRCSEGCGSNHVEDYCDDYEMACGIPLQLGLDDGNKKICGWNSLIFPVIVNLTNSDKSDRTISKNKIINTGTPDTWGDICIDLVSTNIAQDIKTESCQDNNRVKSAVLGEGTYEVYTHHFSNILYNYYDVGVGAYRPVVLNENLREFTYCYTTQDPWVYIIDDPDLEKKERYVSLKVKEFGTYEDDNKLWAIVEVRNINNRASVVLTKQQNDYAYSFYWLFKIGDNDYVGVGLEGNCTDRNGNKGVKITIRWTNASEVGPFPNEWNYASMSCEKMCKENTPIGEEFYNSLCTNDCNPNAVNCHGEGTDGGNWCYSVTGKKCCKCEYEYDIIAH